MSHCKTPERFSTNFRSLSHLFPPFFTPGNPATALLRQDSHFSANFLHVHYATKLDFTKTKPKKKEKKKKKQAHFVSVAGSNLARRLDTILTLRNIALNGNTSRCKHAHTRENTHGNAFFMHIYTKKVKQSNSWWPMLWLRNGP